jgi:hypothetical protein
MNKFVGVGVVVMMRRLSVLICVCGLGACGFPPLPDRVTPDGQLDGASDVSTEPCDRQAAFGPAAAVAGATDVYSANISYDELVVYYGDGEGRIFRTSRESRTSEFAMGSALPGMANGFDPTFNTDETVLYTHAVGSNLVCMTRDSTSADFSHRTVLAVAGSAPFLSPTMVTYGRGVGGTNHLWAAPVSRCVVGTPARLDSLATASGEQEGYPVVSADELEIAFTRGSAILVARRSATTGDFNDARTVDTGPVSQAIPAGFSGDRCRLYISINVPGTQGPLWSLYVMSRPR